MPPVGTLGEYSSACVSVSSKPSELFSRQAVDLRLPGFFLLRRFTAAFKTRVSLEALPGAKAVQESAAKHQMHPNQVSAWKRKASGGLEGVFAGRETETTE